MKPLRVLMVEDSADDAELVLLELRRAGFEVSHLRVQTAPTMREALTTLPWDIVLSDFSMPDFSAHAAIGVLRETTPDLPLIIVSGTVGEDTAVAALHAGAKDFLRKDILGRLGPAIEREVREHGARMARKAAEEALTVTEARLSQRTEQLRQREGMFRELFEAAADGMIVVTAGGAIHVANAAAERMFGYARGELAGAPVEDLVPAARREGHVLHREAYAADPRPRRVGASSDLRVRRKDGVEFSVEVSLAPLQFEGRPTTLAIVRDMTAQRIVEAQLRQAQKMEAVGRLAAGVAHDFNNILSVILSFAQMMEDDLEPAEPMRVYATEIQAAGVRAADLTRQLLTFSRQGVVEPKVLDIDRALAGLENMLRRLLGAHIKLTLLGSPGLWPVKADPGQLEQIVMNLAVNARDAMAEGGSLTIETRNVDLDADYAQEHHDVQAGPHVMLAVTDTGVGIDRETQARIFEPFFTTKEVGRGTGLGLATVFGIVKQHAGHVWVYSEPGVGSTFRVYLPRAAGVAQTAASVRPPPEGARGTETVLLVEDDDHVRAVARGILRRNGYVVLDAPNGGEALLICEQHSATIHLLLTDVVLPRMSGRQLAERLAAARPQMKVLFMSGYTDDAILQHGILNSDVEYLQKPITPGLLTRRVREVLAGEATGDHHVDK